MYGHQHHASDFAQLKIPITPLSSNTAISAVCASGQKSLVFRSLDNQIMIDEPHYKAVSATDPFVRKDCSRSRSSSKSPSKIPRTSSIERIPTAELQKRSMERKIRQATSLFKAQNISDKRILVPNDVSTEAFKRNYSLHDLLCPASSCEPRSKERKTDSYPIRSDPHCSSSSKIPVYKALNQADMHNSPPPNYAFGSSSEKFANEIGPNTFQFSSHDTSGFTAGQQQDEDGYAIPGSSIQQTQFISPDFSQFKPPANKFSGLKTPEKPVDRKTPQICILHHYLIQPEAGTDNESFESAVEEQSDSDARQFNLSNRTTVLEQQSKERSFGLNQSSGSTGKSLDAKQINDSLEEINKTLNNTCQQLDAVVERITESTLKSHSFNAKGGRASLDVRRLSVESPKNIVYNQSSQTTERLKNMQPFGAMQIAQNSSKPLSPAVKKVHENRTSKSMPKKAIDPEVKDFVPVSEERLRFVERKHVEAVRDHTRAQLFLMEEERISSASSGSSSCYDSQIQSKAYSQRSDRLLKEYARRKSEIKAELEFAHQKDLEDLLKHHVQETSRLHAETLLIQQQVKLLSTAEFIRLQQVLPTTRL